MKARYGVVVVAGATLALAASGCPDTGEDHGGPRDLFADGAARDDADASSGPSGLCPIKSSTHFAYYSGSGVGTYSGQWMPHFLNWWNSQPGNGGMEFVALTPADVRTDCDLVDLYRTGSLRLYIQPGGSAYEQNVALGPAGKANINSFIAAGGNYLGVCAGFFYASEGYLWRGYDGYPAACADPNNLCEYSLRLRPSTHGNLLGKYPAIVEGPVQEFGGPWVDAGGVHHGATFIEVGGKRFNAIYWGGPTHGYYPSSTPQLDPDGDPLPSASYPSWTNPLPTSAPAGASVFATLTGTTASGPAALTYSPGSGQGKLLLTTVHLEAHIGQGFTTSSGMTACQERENYKLLANKINEVAGTSFQVPAYDPGCPVTAADGTFEDGTLQGWVPTAGSAGLQIHNSSEQPCGGFHSMYLSDSGLASDTPARVERSVSGKTTLSFRYRTRGLNGATEGLMLYRKIGGAWETSPAWTAPASRSTCTTVSVSVSGASALRFTCHAAGSADYCSVDDISLQ